MLNDPTRFCASAVLAWHARELCPKKVDYTFPACLKMNRRTFWEPGYFEIFSEKREKKVRKVGPMSEKSEEKTSFIIRLNSPVRVCVVSWKESWKEAVVPGSRTAFDGNGAVYCLLKGGGISHPFSRPIAVTLLLL